ncbi:hypothetical protein PMI21_05458 [Pseudomonas sp. GM18]|jgi:hypothetical protein|nr:hypothetical protein PMI21_05458 [Pseudomonas sp. GM18]
MSFTCPIVRPVHVCAYTRMRRGQLEYVCKHCRSMPNR